YDRNTNMRIGLQYNLTDTLGAETQLQTDGSNGGNARLYQSLDGNYHFSENLTLNYGVEVSGNLDGETNALTSVSLGAKWQSEDDHWVANSDIDMTFEDEGETYFADFGVAGEINPALTMLGRARIAVDTRGDAGRDTRARARLGLAYRPIEDSRLNALAWYEYRHGYDGKNAVEHLWSLDASYEASETMTLRGKYAGHKISQDLEFTSDSSLTQLLQAGLNIDLFDDRAQFGLNLMHFWDDLGNQTNAAGIEFGVTPAKGTLLSIGYNASQGSMNHRNEVYQDGIYFRLRIALDNTLLDRLSRFGAE
ncbi:MAG: hypothetical protein ACPGRD_07710, partial [Planktomarina sp.]